MGLLDVLDHHYGATTGESIEVEYRLLSWGEIYPPFLGNREHSTVARFILRDFPFKLFSISIPYSGLPQKICLTFHAPMRERKTEKVTSTGIYPHEAAKEFAAFMSLVTRRRIFAIGQSRADGLPVEEAVDVYERSHFQERQILKEIDPSEIEKLLTNLHHLDKRVAQGFVLATRLYHAAVEMMYPEPEFAYTFLVMSLEAIASAVYKDVEPSDEGEGRTELEHYLDSTYPGWRQHFNITDAQQRRKVIDMLLTKAFFSRRKFRTFVSDNLPEKFWAESEDEAKPEYLYGVIGAGPNGRGREEIRRSDKTIQSLERIKRDDLSKTLDRIYDARSKLVHEGIRFPTSIVIGHFRSIPWDAFAEVMGSRLDAPHNEQLFLDVPPLLTFERLASYAMVEFLSKQHHSPANKQSEK